MGLLHGGHVLLCTVAVPEMKHCQSVLYLNVCPDSFNSTGACCWNHISGALQ